MRHILKQWDTLLNRDIFWDNATYFWDNETHFKTMRQILRQWDTFLNRHILRQWDTFWNNETHKQWDKFWDNETHFDTMRHIFKQWDTFWDNETHFEAYAGNKNFLRSPSFQIKNSQHSKAGPAGGSGKVQNQCQIPWFRLVITVPSV